MVSLKLYGKIYEGGGLFSRYLKFRGVVRCEFRYLSFRYRVDS